MNIFQGEQQPYCKVFYHFLYHHTISIFLSLILPLIQFVHLLVDYCNRENQIVQSSLKVHLLVKAFSASSKLLIATYLTVTCIFLQPLSQELLVLNQSISKGCCQVSLFYRRNYLHDKDLELKWAILEEVRCCRSCTAINFCQAYLKK